MTQSDIFSSVGQKQNATRPPVWYGKKAREKVDEIEVYWSSQRQSLIKNCPSCFRKKYILKVPENPFKKREKKRIYGYGELVHYMIQRSLDGKDDPSDAEIAARAGIQHIDDVKTHVRLLREKLPVLGLDSASTEKEFLCYIQHPENHSEKLDIPLYGIFDLSVLTGSFQMHIADVKSGAQKWAKQKCLNHYQFKGYAYAGWALTGQIPKFDVISLVKRNREKNKDASIANQVVDFKMKDLVDFYNETKDAIEYYKKMVSGDWIEMDCRRHFFCPYK